MSIAKRFLEIYMQKTGLQESQLPDDFHPERLALIQYCANGKGIDVGCGNRKTHPNCIGVDLIASGSLGEYGCVAGKLSVADICASGDDLDMFEDGELDFVVSRHNLEHYVDIIKTLQEWKRILKVGGVMAAVLPDESCINTIVLDPTHKHVFTPESYRRYIDLIGGFRVIEMRTVSKDWSFLCAAEKYQIES